MWSVVVFDARTGMNNLLALINTGRTWSDEASGGACSVGACANAAGSCLHMIGASGSANA
jgi:hypothetical protein